MSEFPETTPSVSPEIAALLENLQKNKTTISTGKNTSLATNSRQNASTLKETTSSSSSSSSSQQVC